MYNDARSKKMVAVINCILNHNARDDSWAKYPGINYEVVDILKKHGVGIIQMPCPEMTVLGLPRTREPGTSILTALDTPEGRARCEELSTFVVDEIEEYIRNGFKVIAILGGDVESPGCAVPAHKTAMKPEEKEHFGVFIGVLLENLRKRGIEIPIRGIRDSARATLDEDLQWLDETLAQS